MVARCPQLVHSSIWPPRAAVRRRAMARRPLIWVQRSQWRLRAMKSAPALRMISATSNCGRLIYSSSDDLPFLRPAHPADWAWHASAVVRGGDSERFLSDRDGLTGSGWCAGRRRLRASEWRSNGGGREDRYVSESRRGGRPRRKRGKASCRLWGDHRCASGCREITRQTFCADVASERAVLRVERG